MFREISRSDWRSFLDEFTLEHDHWLVTVARDDGSKIESEPLEGITARDEEIIVTVGGRRDDHHRIEAKHPRRVVVDEEAGEERALQIESEDGSVLRLTFRAPV